MTMACRKRSKMLGPSKWDNYIEKGMKEFVPKMGASCEKSTPTPGVKADSGKLRWDCLPFDSVEEIVKCLTYGANKYNENPQDPNWAKVKDPKNRYFAAIMRHLSAYKQGQMLDKESNEMHLAHAAANILFLIHFEKQTEDEQKG